MSLNPKPDDLIERIAGATREIRERAGLSLAEVARRGGFGDHYPGRVERGRADPRLSQLTRLARALGLEGAGELMRAAESYRPRPRR
jgi:transcriptional regulator with XRE-family HTH domain